MAMEVVPVKLPPELKREMIAQAQREGMSRSAFMREALIFYMQFASIPPKNTAKSRAIAARIEAELERSIEESGS